VQAQPGVPDRDVVFVVYDGIQALDLTGPFEVLHGANSVLDGAGSPRPRYRLTVASLTGEAVTSESGLSIGASPVGSTPGPLHTLVIPGGLGAARAAADAELVAAVARLARRAGRVVTVCTGARVFAATGLAGGRRMATHWARAAEVQACHPEVRIDPDPIYLRDGDLWSSAGVTAGIDLALALVEHDHDAGVAQVVARWLVMFLRRPGGQTQFAAPVWTERAGLGPIRAAQDLIDAQPGDDHRVGRLAGRVGMSERHFTRRFTEETGTSPAQYVAAVRLDAARAALEATGQTVEAIAVHCGFGTAETMRRTFTRRLGVSPDRYRRRFTILAAAPAAPAADERSPA
jgi:transcriptional regulator GlxA family with amidase domain